MIGPTERRPLRRIRIHVTGFVDLNTDDADAEAVDFAARQMAKIYLEYGFALRQDSLEIKQPLEL